MIGETILYTANTGMASIATANSGLDGGGTLGTVLTAASNGTLIKNVTIKGQEAQTGGMVRLYIHDGSATRLFMEVEIPPASGGSNSQYKTVSINLPINFSLKATWILKASTEKAKAFNVIAEGLDWKY